MLTELFGPTAMVALIEEAQRGVASVDFSQIWQGATGAGAQRESVELSQSLADLADETHNALAAVMAAAVLQ
ncbi:MAG: hypothetical protein Q4A71_05790 [Actinomycetaceae bacterium]|nr:hypothetical protein [Actinomycetaceae bacterium]